MDAPKIYHASEDTRELLGEGYADPDPMDPTNWLVPAWAYLDAPPARKAGFAILRTVDRTAWEYVEDHRGQVYNTSTGEALDHTELGPLPAGITDKPYPGKGYQWNGEAWVLDQEYEVARRAALALRDERLVTAGLRIVPLQDAMDLYRIDQGDVTALLAWKNYRINLSRIERQSGFPTRIVWPASPDGTRAV